MSHKYWETDTDERHEYFEDQFFSNAKFLAENQKIPLNTFLGQVHNFTSFVSTLKQAMSVDTSLAEYVDGMSNNALREFFNRSKIQALIHEKYPSSQEPPPEIISERGKPEKYFKAYQRDPITGRKHIVLAKREEVTIRGVKRIVYRGPNGRFATLT